MKATTIERKAVLITGASSGLGEITAHELARRGFRVFAGVRDALAAERLRAALGPRCEPVTLDVTDSASIAAAAATLRAAGGLYGLVNNAGIVISGPLEFLPLDALRTQFEVNVTGAIAVTQAMLPLLRRSLGRIVNVGSIAGRGGFPTLGPYNASKAALQMLSMSLRIELGPFDIGVSYIEPGAHRTPIWERSRRRAAGLEAQLSPLAVDYYGGVLDAMRALTARAEQKADDPRNVARVIARALEARRPRARYTVGSDTRAYAIYDRLPLALKERVIVKRLATGAP